MPSFSKLYYYIMLVTLVAGCSPETDKGRPVVGSLACRIVATPDEHPVVVDAAMNTGRHVVAVKGRSVGEWVPLDPNSLAADEVDNLPQAVTRERKGVTELLVTYSKNDISEADAAFLETDVADGRGRPAVRIHLTDSGSTKLFTLTANNIPEQDGTDGQNIAVIVEGKVRVIAKIRQPISGEFFIAYPTKAGASRLADALTAE